MMKKLIFTLCFLVAAAIGALKGDAQTVTREQLPMVVAEMNKMCPQSIGDGVAMTKVYLKKDNTQMWFDFSWNTRSTGFTPAQLIEGFEGMSEEEKRGYLGQEFVQMAKMFPAAMFANLIFQDGKTYVIQLSE